MFDTITSLTPQQTFLIQGGAATAQALAASAPYIEHIESARFTVEDARSLVSWAGERAGSSAWMVWHFDMFVPDAAEVLLKTLEEPGAGITIVLITPHPYLVPETIRSRVRILVDEQTTRATPAHLASKKALEAYIKETLADEDTDASIRRAYASALLDDIEVLVQKDRAKVALVYEAKSLLHRANLPTKQVAEYVLTMVF